MKNIKIFAFLSIFLLSAAVSTAWAKDVTLTYKISVRGTIPHAYITNADGETVCDWRNGLGTLWPANEGHSMNDDYKITFRPNQELDKTGKNENNESASTTAFRTEENTIFTVSVGKKDFYIKSVTFKEDGTEKASSSDIAPNSTSIRVEVPENKFFNYITVVLTDDIYYSLSYDENLTVSPSPSMTYNNIPYYAAGQTVTFGFSGSGSVKYFVNGVRIEDNSVIVRQNLDVQIGVPYIDEKGERQIRKPGEYTVLTSLTDVSNLGGGWYVVQGEVEYTNQVKFSGDAHLILADGAEMEIVTEGESEHGIYASKNLTIYGQNGQSGILNDTANGTNGSGIYSYSGDITINGGTVTATGDYGIYSYNGVTINGGSVTATGTNGRGIYGKGDVTISGGTVRATGTSSGIYSYNGVTINGGSVTATSTNGIGIGIEGNITISGGTVRATSTNGHGIDSEGKITINGGSVTATSTNSRGIYSYNGVTISGGTVEASGSNYGIYSKGTVTINGGKVEATGYYGIDGYNGITLDWTNSTDFIKASSYYSGEGTVQIAEGKLFKDEDGNVYRGTLSSTQLDIIKKKTLEPCYAVTLNLQDGNDPVVVAATSDENGVAHVAKPADPIRSGFTFEGWFTATDGNTEFDFSAAITGNTTAYAHWNENTPVEYIDENGGTNETKNYILLTNDINVDNLPGGWYVVQGKVEYSNQVKFSGDAHLILADEAKLEIKSETYGILADKNLTIYGQNGQSGILNDTAKGTNGSGIYSYFGDITIIGGKVTATATGSGSFGIYGSKGVKISGGSVTATGGDNGIRSYKEVTISGGSVTATGTIGFGIYSYNGVTISGGTVTATSTNGGGIYSNSGNITLGWTNSTDFIKASSYYSYKGSVQIAKGKSFKDEDGKAYSGPLTGGQLSAIKSKKLEPCYAVTFDAQNGDDPIMLLTTFDENGVAHVAKPNDPIRSGFTFEGWFTATDGNTEFDFSAAITGNTTAYAHWNENTPVEYIDENGGTNETKNYILLTNDINVDNLSGGWYVVQGAVKYTSQVKFSGDAHLILADGAEMEIKTEGKYGIYASNNLTIYGQNGQSGILNDTAKGTNGIGIYSYSGNITINGGKVTATGKNYGIDSYNNVTINGGTVTATGTNGRGIYGNGDVTISGGTVTATGNDYGIFSWSDITIIGGSVTATSTDGYGIYSSRNVTISGGKVTATGENGDGIYSEKGHITLGWTNSTDFIKVSSILLGADSCTVSIAEGKSFVDENGNEYRGTLTDENLESIKNKTLTPLMPFPDNIVIANISGATYTGDSIRPEPVVTIGENELELGKDYTLAYKDNLNASDTAKVIVKGAGKYYGEVQKLFTIDKAPLMITALNDTIVYGDKPASAGVAYDGFVGNETSEVLKGELALEIGYKQYDDAGKYAITPSDLNADNYKIEFVAGTLTVEPKVISIVWGEQTVFAYDGKAHAPNAAAEGLVNNDECNLVIDSATEVGNHIAKVTGLSNKNYKLPATGLEKEFKIVMPIAYIDENGVEQTVKDYTVLTQNTSVGNLPEGWYVVQGKVKYSSQVMFNGDAHLILADGATMEIETEGESEHGIYASNNLTIYGQSMQSDQRGILNATAKGTKGTGIYSYSGDITIIGGMVTATGYNGIYSYDGNITLGWTNSTDNIKASSYYSDNGSVKIAEGKSFKDGNGKAYSGTLTGGQLSAIKSKKLEPCYAVTFDAQNGDEPIMLLTTFDENGVAHVEKTNDPIRSGFTFEGWFTATDGNTEFDFTKAVTGNTTAYAHWNENTPVEYIDEKGETKKTKNYILLTNGINVDNLSGGWYVVEGDVRYTNTVKFNEDAYLILADGAKLEIKTEGLRENGIDVSGNLAIYGQSGQSGILADSAKGSSSNGIKSSGNVTISGITVTATGDFNGISSSGNVTISGGNVTATGSDFGIYSNSGNITLGWTNSTDRIQASKYGSPNGNVVIAEGQAFKLGGYVYSGTLSKERRIAIGGKTLSPLLSGVKVAFVDTQDGKQVTVATRLVDETGHVTAPYQQPRSGYTVGWFTTAEGDTKFDFASTITADTTVYAKWVENAPVEYIDEQGDTQTVTDYVLLTENIDVSENLTGGWYVVQGKVSYYKRVQVEGDMNLILADGAKMDVENGSDAIYIQGNLTIYGQSGQSGILTVASKGAHGIYCYGNQPWRVRSFSSLEGFYGLRSNNGSGGYVTIAGGNVTVTGEITGIYGSNDITLSLNNNSSSFIKASSYYSANGNVIIPEGKSLKDEKGNVYSGTLNDDQIATIAGKTLVPPSFEGKFLSDVNIAVADIPVQKFVSGKPVCPSVVVTDGKDTLTAGTDYAVTCFNNTAVTSATLDEAAIAQITGKGNYAGAIQKRFFIWKNIRDYAAVQVFKDAGGKTHAEIDGAYDGADAVAIDEYVAVDTVVFSREFTVNLENGGFSTIMLPFDVSASNLTGVKSIFEFDDVDNNAVGVKYVWCNATIGKQESENGHPDCNTLSGELNAYTPYMVEMETPTLGIKDNVTLKPSNNATNSVVSKSNWVFRGALQKKDFSKKDQAIQKGIIWAFAGSARNGASIGKFVQFGGNNWVNPFRAYLVDCTTYSDASECKDETQPEPSFVSRYRFADALAPTNSAEKSAGAAATDQSLVMRGVAASETASLNSMDIVIVYGDKDSVGERPTVIGRMNPATGEIRMLPRTKQTYDLKGRRVNEGRKAKGAYYRK